MPRDTAQQPTFPGRSRTTSGSEMPPQTMLRPLLAEDAEIAAGIFYKAVLQGTTDQYSFEERHAWAGPRPDPERWRDRIGQSVGLMAEVDGKPAGFMTFVAPDEIDLAFVLPHEARKGLGSALYSALEPIARACGARQLTCFASRTSRPFFARHGFETLHPRIVHRRGVPLTGYVMRKGF